MKAVVFKGVGEPLSYQEFEEPRPKGDEVVVELKAAALNHRDNWMTKGKYPNLQADTILGSDGAGVFGGREVIINPNNNWGGDERFASADYHILGMPTHGTFAEKIALSADRLVDKPAHLSMEQAAALPLAGMTAYRALISRCQVQASDRVLISGIGGGVALFAFQFALAVGAEVYVTSSSEQKIETAVEMGGRDGALYTEEGWARAFRKQTGGFDVIIDSAGGEGFADLVRLTKPGARMALYGGTRGNWQNVSPQVVFFRQLSIFGSTMASDKEFGEMVAFVNAHKIVPVVDSVFPLAEVNEAIGRMEAGLQFGKIVLRIE